VGLALAVGATVAAGCGGEEGPSREEFVQSANQICQQRMASIQEAAGRLLAGGQLPDPREFMQLARQTIIPQVSAQVNDLQQVEPPEELSQEYQEFLDMSSAARERITQDPTAIQNPANFREVNQQAQQLGLSCRIGPG